MKQISIKKVSVNNAGPVHGFEHFFAPLTLIHGSNESGKTTVLDNMVHCLFKSKAGDIGKIGHSRIVLDTPDGEKLLEPGQKGLAALLPESFGAMPEDLGRLLYIRAGDPELESAAGGVSRTMVKGLVSNQQVYDRIENFLPNESGYTHIENGILHGKSMGMMKKLSAAKDRLTALNEMADKFHNATARTEIARLRRDEAVWQLKLEEQDAAKRHKAWQTAQELLDIESKRDRLDRRKFESLQTTLFQYNSCRDSIAANKKKIKQYSGAKSKHDWLISARKNYLELSGGRKAAEPAWHLPALMVLTAAAALTFAFSAVAGAVFSIAALAVAGLRLFSDRTSRQHGADGTDRHLEEIRTDFSKKFGTKPGSVADFDMQIELLRDDMAMCRTAEEQLREKEREMESCRAVLETELSPCLSGKIGYEATLKKLFAAWEKLDGQWHKLNNALAVLGVDEENYLETGSGVTYSAKAFERAGNELAKIADGIRSLEEDYRSLCAEAGGMVGTLLPESPEKAAELIEDVLQSAESEVRELMAALYAAVLVKEVLRSFVSEEDKRVESWLKTAGIGKQIKAVTGRYDRLTFSGEELMIGSSKESFPLAALSSGAVEQVLLAIRMGIAPQVTGQQAMFLLLDDAFQFSDWDRRALMVDAVESIVKSGWQVVYFTMDEDIRKRISGLGKRLGKGMFREIGM